MPRSWDDWFWISAAIVAGVVLMFAGRALFRAPKPRRARWLPFVAGLTLMLPTACAHVPAPPPAPTPNPVWDNAGFAPDLQRT